MPCPGCKSCFAALSEISQKAEIFSINAGAVWNIKFDENTKLIGWNAPIGKIPRDKEIAVVSTQQGSEIYARERICETACKDTSRKAGQC